MSQLSRISRAELLAKEHKLHDRLAEITRRISNARATLQIYEDQLQQTIMELNDVRQQLEQLDQTLESIWQGTSKERNQDQREDRIQG